MCGFIERFFSTLRCKAAVTPPPPFAFSQCGLESQVTGWFLPLFPFFHRFFFLIFSHCRSINHAPFGGRRLSNFRTLGSRLRLAGKWDFPKTLCATRPKTKVQGKSIRWGPDSGSGSASDSDPDPFGVSQPFWDLRTVNSRQWHHRPDTHFVSQSVSQPVIQTFSYSFRRLVSQLTRG